jgi:hypothetical protein
LKRERHLSDVLEDMSSLEHLTLGPQESTITSEMETTQGHQADEMQKLAEYLRTLREERGKVEAFKRELPLCLQLIDEGGSYH